MPDLRPNIVVVDDDPGMNQAVERMLKAAGFKTVTFPSAETLLEAGEEVNADCLILDIHLPGLSGFELCRHLGTIGAKAPVIFMTAYDDSASRTEAQRAGAVAYLTKPFPGESLLTAITKALEPS
jgi:FixJ family two-component response regulator